MSVPRASLTATLLATTLVSWSVAAPASALTLAERSAILAKGEHPVVVVRPFALAAASLATSASPLPATPATGTLDSAGKGDDAFAVSLVPGQRFTAVLTAPAGTDYDLYLHWPNAVSLATFDIAAAAVSTSYPDTLVFDAAAPGTYTLDVHAFTGAGAYSVAWTIGTALATPTTRRMAGLDRYGTAADIIAKTFVAQPSHDIVLACGDKFPDALSASGLAGALGCPLALTTRDSIPATVTAAMQRLGVVDVHIVGGTGAISSGVQAALQASGYRTYRYAGADRYGTSAAVAEAVYAINAEPPDIAFLARGDLFPDALSVSPIAYQHAYPVLLTRSTTLSPSARGVLAGHSVPRVVIAGGNQAVSSVVASAVAGLPHGPRVDRVAGANRYGTAEQVARFASREYLATPSDVGLASGTSFADALSGGTSTGARGGVMLLTYGNVLAVETRTLMSTYASLGLIDRLTIYGGTAAVSAAVESDASGVIR